MPRFGAFFPKRVVPKVAGFCADNRGCNSLVFELHLAVRPISFGDGCGRLFFFPRRSFPAALAVYFGGTRT